METHLFGDPRNLFSKERLGVGKWMQIKEHGYWGQLKRMVLGQELGCQNPTLNGFWPQVRSELFSLPFMEWDGVTPPSFPLSLRITSKDRDPACRNVNVK